MDESDDDWSIHDLDRVPEPSPDVTLSPRNYSMSSRRSSGGYMDSSQSSLRRLNNDRVMEVGGGRRFQRRGWGSTAGGASGGGGPLHQGSTTGASTTQNAPPSLNLEAVVSFPPMSDEQIALSNEAAEVGLRRSGSAFVERSPSMGLLRSASTDGKLRSHERSPSLGVPRDATSETRVRTRERSPSIGLTRPTVSDPNLASHGSWTGQSWAEGHSVGGGASLSTLRDESMPEQVEADDDVVQRATQMPLHAKFANNPLQQQSVTTGFTPQQRLRLENLGSRPRLDTGGSSTNNSNMDNIVPMEKYNEVSESSEGPQVQISEARRRIGSIEIVSDSSWVDETENGGGEEDTEAGESTTVDTRKVIVLWGGFELPYWLVSWPPSLHRVSTLVVTRAPCFICWGFRQPTDRTILARLNILVSFVATLQIAATIFLAAVSWNKPGEHAIDNQSHEEEATKLTRGPVLFNVWTTNVYIYFSGLLAFINLAAAILTIRVVRNVNLMGAIRYLWGKALALPVVHVKLMV